MFDLKKVVNRVIKWFIFSVLVGILPLAWKAIQLKLFGGNIEVTDIYGEGELVLVGNAITAGSIGELLTHNKNQHEFITTFKYICGGFSVLILLTTTYWFSILNLDLSSNLTYNKDFINLFSPILFLLNLGGSLGCLISSEF